MGLRLFGAKFGRLAPAERREAILEALRHHRMLLVWDNFETVHSMPAESAVTRPLDEAGRRARPRDRLTLVMGSSTTTPFPSSAEELEALIRRVVREEFGALLQRSRIEIEQEDEALAGAAMAILEADRDRPEAWISWEEAKAEIARAEAAGELPD